MLRGDVKMNPQFDHLSLSFSLFLLGNVQEMRRKCAVIDGDFS